MRYMDRCISLLILAAAIAAPTATIASPKPQEGTVQVRIFDRDHRDYHNWDDREDRAYRVYLPDFATAIAHPFCTPDLCRHVPGDM